MILALTSAIVSGCAGFLEPKDGAPDRKMDWESIPDAVPKEEPLSRSGNPESYIVFDKRYYVLKDAKNFNQTGIASWYGTKFHGQPTASGEIYDMYKMTAAHKTLPIPTYVKVKNLATGKEITVKVNDRGPFVDGRIIDLSYAAANKLGITSNGTAQVEINAVYFEPVVTSFSVKNTPATPKIDAVYYYQVGAFRQKELANNFARELTALDISPLDIHTEDLPDGSMIKVRVGPLLDEQQVDNTKTQLLDLGFSDAFLVAE